MFHLIRNPCLTNSWLLIFTMLESLSHRRRQKAVDKGHKCFMLVFS